MAASRNTKSAPRRSHRAFHTWKSARTSGMNQGIQGVQRIGVRKHLSRQSRPIQPAIFTENVRPKPVHHDPQQFGVFVIQTLGSPVCIEDRIPQASEHTCETVDLPVPIPPVKPMHRSRDPSALKEWGTLSKKACCNIRQRDGRTPFSHHGPSHRPLLARRRLRPLGP